MSTDWFDPEAALERIRQPVVASPFGPAPAPQVAEYGNTTPWVIDSLAGAARGVASFLEPFQLPQDVMFSLLAGWQDPDKSAVEYFRGDKGVWDAVTAYAPGGEAPNRPASGEDILRLFGVEDARAAKWGGRSCLPSSSCARSSCRSLPLARWKAKCFDRWRLPWSPRCADR